MKKSVSVWEKRGNVWLHLLFATFFASLVKSLIFANGHCCNFFRRKIFSLKKIYIILFSLFSFVVAFISRKLDIYVCVCVFVNVYCIYKCGFKKFVEKKKNKIIIKHRLWKLACNAQQQQKNTHTHTYTHILKKSVYIFSNVKFSIFG